MVKFIRQVHHAVYVKYDFGIRVDMGKEIGSGHFYRCLSLAEEILNNGKEVTFIVKNDKEFLSHIGNRKIPFMTIKNENIENEIKSCKNTLNSIKNLIIDLPTHNEIYGKSFFGICKTATIDDLGNMKVFSNYLFNGSIVNEYHYYKKINKKSQIYTGPKYMILRKEFLNKRKEYSISKKEIRNILLTFGGSDELGLAQKFIHFFGKKNYKVIIVIGPSFKKIDMLIDHANKFDNIRIKTSVEDMASLFVKQDLVISSAGITSYELACLGVPSILIPVDKYQLPTAMNMESNGCAINYGHWDNNFIKIDKIINVLADYGNRKKIYQSGRKMIDGKGCSRVAKNLLNMN